MTKAIFKNIILLGFLFISTTVAFAQTNADTAQIVLLKNFSMPQLSRERTIRVYLPKGYNTSNKTYPVIYMTDGQNIFKSSAAIKSTWAVDSMLNSLPANKQCIIVGIDHAGKDRITEYNPYNSTYGKGDGVAYSQFLAETLKPYIDAHYRTKKEARYNAIAGSSLGSLLAMYAVVKYPDSFGNAGIFSPAFWIGQQIYTDTETATLNKKAGFYLVCGDSESADEVKYVNKMDSVLHAKKFTAQQVPPTIIKAGAKHNEAQWRSAFPDFYRWVIDRFGL